jgi:hypothetical protein
MVRSEALQPYNGPLKNLKRDEKLRAIGWNLITTVAVGAATLYLGGENRQRAWVAGLNGLAINSHPVRPRKGSTSPTLAE